MFDRQGRLGQAGRDVDGPDVYAVFPRLEGDIHACGGGSDLAVASVNRQRGAGGEAAQVGGQK
jgi:hypothetical protein